jgi:hypothetical protein
MTSKAFITILSGALLVSFTAMAEKTIDASKLPPASSKKGVTYATDIKPIFETSCFKCHSSKSEKIKGKLKVDSAADVIKGGENGPDIIIGDSAKSKLVAAISHVGDEDDFMPPVGNKAKIPPLTKEQIGIVRAWIDQGAK